MKQTIIQAGPKMVCAKSDKSSAEGEEKASLCVRRKDKQGQVRRVRLKTDKKDIIKQYRKLIAVLPNVTKNTKISKVRHNKLHFWSSLVIIQIFQRLIVEEAILYIEELQKQLMNNVENVEECGH